MLIKVVLIILLMAGGWLLYENSRTLTEKDVRVFYEQTNHEMRMRNAEALCAQLAPNFKGLGVTVSGEDRYWTTIRKKKTCDGYQTIFRGWDRAAAQLNYSLIVLSIRIAPDGRSAEVQTEELIDVAGAPMVLRASSTDTLIKQNWVTLIEASEYRIVVGSR